MSTTLRDYMSRKRSSIPKGWTGFMSALRNKQLKRLEDMGAVPISKAVNQIEDSGIVGGYAVPPDFNLMISTTYEEETFWYQRATVVPMLSLETTMPVPNAITAQAAGTAPWFGGMDMGWGKVAGVVQQTNPTLAQVRLTAKNLIGTVVMSNDLAADLGPGGDEFIFTIFARSAAYYEELAFLQGTGFAAGSTSQQAQPLGVINSPGTVNMTRQTLGAIVQQDVSNIAKSLAPKAWTKAIWVCSPTALGQVSGIAGYVPNQQNGFDTDMVSAAGSLMGRPLFVTDKVPALGTKGDLGLYDPSQYVIGDRAELIVQAGTEVPPYFAANQTVYRIWRRVDGTTIYSSPITLTDSTTKVSASVTLV